MKTLYTNILLAFLTLAGSLFPIGRGTGSLDNNQEVIKLERREFLLNSALMASGLMGAGMMGCTSPADERGRDKYKDIPRIDSFCHFSTVEILDYLEKAVPQPGYKHVFRDLFTGTKTLIDVNARLAMMDKNGIDLSILVPLPWIETLPPPFITPEVSLGAARLLNNQLAEIAQKNPKRFRAVALLPTKDKAAMLEEFERAVKKLGMVGGFFVTGFTVKPPDHPDYFNADPTINDNLYAKAVELDVPLWLHPSKPPVVPDYQGEERSQYQVWQTLSWLLDSSTAMHRIVFAGVFKKHPQLKMIIHHHGALVPLFHERMTYGWEFFEKNNKVPLSTTVSKPYIDHFKKFYCDTATQGYNPMMIRMAHNFFGPDRVLFGSDAPMDAQNGDIFTRGARNSVEDLDLPKDQVEKIYNGNIRKLIKLNEPVPEGRNA